MNVRHSLHRITNTALLAAAFGLLSTAHAMVSRPADSMPIPVPAVSEALPVIGADPRGAVPTLVAPTACTKSSCIRRATSPSVPLLVAPCHGGCYGPDQLAPVLLPSASSDDKPLLVAPTCGSHCTRTGDGGPAAPIAVDQLPSVAGSGCRGTCTGSKFDAAPVLVAPGCPSCWMKGGPRPTFDGEPQLVAPDCSSVKCGVRGGSRSDFDDQPLLVAPNCTNGCGIRGGSRSGSDHPSLG